MNCLVFNELEGLDPATLEFVWENHDRRQEMERNERIQEFSQEVVIVNQEEMNLDEGEDILTQLMNNILGGDDPYICGQQQEADNANEETVESTWSIDSQVELMITGLDQLDCGLNSPAHIWSPASPSAGSTCSSQALSEDSSSNSQETSSSSDDSDEDYMPKRKPPARRRGKPRRPRKKTPRKPLVTKQTPPLAKAKITRWLLKMLRSPYHQSVVRWLDQSEGRFRILDQLELARLWGEAKCNPTMNYEKFRYFIKRLLNGAGNY